MRVPRPLALATLALLATTSLLAACGSSPAATASPTVPATASPTGPVDLLKVCNDLTGAGPALTPTGTYPTPPTTDGDGMAITVPATTPQKIITTTPTDTEIVAALGAGDRLIGIDANSDYPINVTNKPIITDSTGFSLNTEQIITLKPDLVLGYGTFTQQDDKTLRAAGINVITLPPLDLTGSIGEILFVGKLIGAQQEANTVVARMERCIHLVESTVKGQTPVATYMELDYSTPGKPYTFGKGSFGDEMISDAGGANIFASDADGAGYPQVTDEAVIAANPQVIILTEPAQYLGQAPAARPTWASVSAVKNGRVVFLDGNLTSRTGPRIVEGLAKIAVALWPNLFVD